MPSRRRRIVATVIGAAFAVSIAAPALAVNPPARPAGPIPQRIEKLKLRTAVTGTIPLSRLAVALRAARGPQQVVVRLSEKTSVDVAASGAVAEKAQYRKARAQQAAFIASAKTVDRSLLVLGRTGRASNVVMLRVDAKALTRLAVDPAVVSINPVRDYQMSLGETVPYVGGKAVQAAGFTGRGVKVAVLDSGIDYTHAAFGGPGTVAAYRAAYGSGPSDPKNTTTDGLFPTARVVGGYDFVGEAWTGGSSSPALAPDPDPIDHEGHGTHVADIIGGARGVAPRVSLYAVKVCSAVATACSGVALIQGMDFAVDPNGDGSTADHVDVVNMSLGSLYGIAFDDDLSYAVDQASRLGVLSVTAAGNGANKPYILDTPSAATSALSVAQTQVPSARLFPLVVNSPAAIAGSYPNTETVAWAPVGSGFSGDVAFVGRGCPAGSVTATNPDDPYAVDPHGKVALIDRGGCSVSLKVDRAARAGATAVLIGLVAPGDPVTFSSGGGDTFVPTLVIQQSLSSAIKGQLAAGQAVKVSVSNAVTLPLVGSMVGSSSRGPSMDANLLKPEIGAPGASVSAIVGTGTGTEAFGGTSGAAPMVSGAAALLHQAFPRRSVSEIKSLLMNTAETQVYTSPATQPGVLAPISRIGGGELRVDRALRSPAAAWDTRTKAGGLSFGFVDASRKVTTLTRQVTVRNYGKSWLTYKVTPTFRYANDAATGAVKVSAPRYVSVPPKGTRTFNVSLRIDGSKLRPWTMDAGANGANPTPLDLLEYDGYLNLDNTRTSADNADPLHVAWHVLPRLSDDVRRSGGPLKIGAVATDGPLVGLPVGTTTLRNEGVGAAYVDAYSLVGTSPNLPPSVRGGNAPVIDLRAVGVQTYPVGEGYCSENASFVYSIAINTWERSTLALAHNQFWVYLDTNHDGVDDYVVLNSDFSTASSGDPYALSDGRSVTYAFNLATGDGSAYFFTDHATNAANMVLTICGEQIGMDATSYFQPMRMTVVAYDNYFTGNATDAIRGIEVAPLGERYVGVIGADGFISGDIAPFSSAKLTVGDLGAAGTNPSETGLMLVLDANRVTSHGGAPKGNESLLLHVLP